MIASPFSAAPEFPGNPAPRPQRPASTEALQALDGLIASALEAKLQAQRHQAVYDALREQIAATLRDLGVEEAEAAVGRARLKQTHSGWIYSEQTQALAVQLKAQQAIEKRNGLATASKTTLSADVFER